MAHQKFACLISPCYALLGLVVMRVRKAPIRTCGNGHVWNVSHQNFQCWGLRCQHGPPTTLCTLPEVLSIFWDLDFVKKDSWSLTTYCWWKKSRTTWDVSNPLNTGIIHINWCRISSINSREVLDCEKVRSNNKSRWIVCLGGFLLVL